MNLSQTTEKLTSLIDRIRGYINEEGEYVDGINDWISKHPGTDPNAYEIMDCNVRFAEILAELRAYYVKNGKIDATAQNSVPYMIAFHPEIEECYYVLETMDELRDTDNHPFFTTKEAQEMYYTVKCCQDFASYVLPQDEAMRRIKREVLCKSMSVPFYIWQVHRTEPNYQYDNKAEFEEMKEAFALYEASEEPCQFLQQVSNLHNKIEKDYKYSTQDDTNKKLIK